MTLPQALIDWWGYYPSPDLTLLTPMASRSLVTSAPRSSFLPTTLACPTKFFAWRPVEDTRLTNTEQRFRITVFNCLVDTVTSQVPQLFTILNHLVTKFSILFPNVLSSTTEHDMIIISSYYRKHYSSDLSEAFPVQLVTLASSLKSEISKLSSVKDLAHLLVVDYTAMTSAFTDVVTALLLFLTLPVTVATAEGSYSKLRLIKSYLRSTVRQDQICALALLSIGAELAKLMQTEKLIECFASAKAHRKTFCRRLVIELNHEWAYLSQSPSSHVNCGVQ